MNQPFIERPARIGTRERILAVSHDAIIAKGFDATSVEEISSIFPTRTPLHGR
jgi:AcrR family transcriptional regulator